MELKELSRRISRYRANAENLQLEKNRLLNEIDALDQEALKIKLAQLLPQLLYSRYPSRLVVR